MHIYIHICIYICIYFVIYMYIYTSIQHCAYIPMIFLLRVKSHYIPKGPYIAFYSQLYG